MMFLGLAGMPLPDEWPLVADLGVTHMKCAHSTTTAEPAACLAYVELLAEHDLTPIVDLRVEHEQIAHLYDQVRQAHVVPTGTSEGGVASLTRRNWLRTMDAAAEQTYETVTLCKHLCRDWEVWGEFTCPIVSQGSFTHFDYTLHLAAQYDAIRQADPAARVWLGGGGIRGNVGWLRAMLAPNAGSPEWQTWFPEGVGDRFDVVNWHHYGHTADVTIEDYGLEQQIAQFDRYFPEAAELVARCGRGQPNASTEWGLPMVAEEHRGAGFWGMLNSQATDLVIPAIPDSLSGLWYEECFRCFERHGFEVLCVHELRERMSDHWEHGFWGAHCGLLDLEGRPRQAFETVQRWAWRARESGAKPFAGGMGR